MIYTFIKKLSVVFLFLLLLLGFPQNESIAQAQDNKDYFNVNADISYNVMSGTKTKVTQVISIINKKEFVYSPGYSITMHVKNISDIRIENSSSEVPYTLEEGQGNEKKITITFPEKIIGLEKVNKFTFSFVSSDFTQKTGSTLSVTIPSLSGGENFKNYVIHITLPQEYEKPTIVKPDVPFTKEGDTYTFSQNPQLKNGVELIFGASQLYEFHLSYHLENKNVFSIRSELALPPNTSYQEVLLQDLSPKPTNIYSDPDGNMLATYSIPPKTTINVNALALVKVVSVPREEELSVSTRAHLLKPQKYWESNDPEIKKIANNLKTPKNIFDYVVKTLSYDAKKTDSKNERLGAKEVLTKPYFAVCFEFTDLFIALARAAGIPARSVAGYAYTNDLKDRPLSLLQDVLHAWPEYYDTDKKTWIMVDPTWENTTGGIDYFNSLDFDHVAFVVNGSQSTYPVPAGGYKTKDTSKDITVTYPDNTSFVKVSGVSMQSSFSSFASNNKLQGKITLQNNGNFELTSYPARVFVDNVKALTVTFPKTPPLGKTTLSIEIPLPTQKDLLSLTNITHRVTIQGEDGQILVKATTRTFPFSEYVVIGGAIFIGLAFVFIIAYKTRSIPV